MKDTCEHCKHCHSSIDAAGFIWYRCGLKPGIVVGESNYLDGDWFAEACEKKEGEENAIGN